MVTGDESDDEELKIAYITVIDPDDAFDIGFEDDDGDGSGDGGGGTVFPCNGKVKLYQ